MKHVAQFVHSLDVGGAEVLAVNIAGGLKHKGYHCSLWGMAGGSALLPRLKVSEIPSSVFDCPRGISLRVMAAIARIIVRDRVDYLVTHHFRQLFHALPGAVLLRRRLIHVEHDYHFYEGTSKYLRILRFLLRFTSGFVAVSQGVASAFEAGFSGQVRCFPIPNGIDVSHFLITPDTRSRMRQIHGCTDEHLVIGTCARLEPVKQVELLIRGFAEYAADNPHARLVIVGGGSERDMLVELVEQLMVAHQVYFAGVCSAVSDYLAMFDIFALTSRNEGLPLALLEAMAAGLPAVATDVGSIASVVTPQTGVLLKKQTPGHVAQAFHELNNAALRTALGEAARQLVQAEYSQERMIQSYIKVLEANSSSGGCL